MTRVFVVPSAFAALLALSCSGVKEDQIGAGEPFRVTAGKSPTPAQFIQGKLPGTKPPERSATSPAASAAAPADAGADNSLPEIVEFSSASFAFQGQGDVGAHGTASEKAYAVGLALQGIGSGYWVVPVQGIDVATGNREWSVSCDFGTAVPAGYQQLLAVALDGNGLAGPQSALRICVVPDDIQGFFAPCDHSNPPEAVISLTWDANVDLDLQVLTPEGRLIDPKHPTALPPDDAGVVPPDTAQIDRDSNAGCRIDGIRTESLVWSAKAGMPHGSYGIYVNLFDACKQPAVRFRVDVYSVVPNPDGGVGHLKNFFSQGGELLDFQANGGAGRGLFVSQFVFK